MSTVPEARPKAPLRGALVVGARTEGELAVRLRDVLAQAAQGRMPARSAPARADLNGVERVAIDYGDADELADKASKALFALQTAAPAVWRAMRAQGIHRGGGRPAKVAFLYPGQGSQYVNMFEALRRVEPIVDHALAGADQVMQGLIGRPARELICADSADEAAMARAEAALRNTAVGQPAVLAADAAMAALLAAYGITPDLVAGHSLGEYAAMAAAGGLRPAAALEVASAIPWAEALDVVGTDRAAHPRRALAWFDVEPGAGGVDRGAMAAVFAPGPDIERVLAAVAGYVIVANANSSRQSVIGGTTAAVQRAIDALTRAGVDTLLLPVNHAFHTDLVAPAIPALRHALLRLRLRPPTAPLIANLSGEPYPTGPRALPQVLDTLSTQFARPIRFALSVERLWSEGVRIFVEVGPRKAVSGFVEDLVGQRPGAVVVHTNHPKVGELVSFNHALCALYAAGLGDGVGEAA